MKKWILLMLFATSCAYKPVVDTAGKSGTFTEDKAKEIAEEFNLLPEFLNDFIEYYADICVDSDEGYSLINDKSLIDDWWDHNKDLYETKTPFIF